MFSGTPSLQAPPTTGATLGSLRIVFEKTPLGEIVQAAGGGAIRHQGDAGHSLYYLCYDLAQADRRERIWMVSDGEMGGSGQAVTAIIATRLAQHGGTAHCPRLPQNLTPASFDARIWLGMPEQSLESQLGAPSSRQGRSQSFAYAGKAAGRCPGGADVTAWLSTQAQDGQIDFIAAGQVTTC
jgi:hypothetical protein